MDTENPNAKAQMADTCGQRGVTPAASVSQEQMLADTDQILADFASDYERMAQ